MIASLITSLADSGSRKSDGSVNASGRVWAYQPGTLTPAVVYEDADAEVQATQPITLDAAGKAEVFTTQPVRLVVERVVSTGVYATVSDTDFIPAAAGNVGVANDGWTGVNPDTGSQEAGGHTTLDAVLTSLADSFGGTDGKYKEYTGATERKLVEVLRGIQVSVKDYGAVGNGIATDTTAVQAAVNEVSRLGGGIVYLDPGTYLTNAAISVTSANVSIIGAGMGASVIKATNASQNAITASSATNLVLESFSITHSSTSTGTAISLTGCNGAVVTRVGVDPYAASGTFLMALDVAGGAASVIDRCSLTSRNAAGGRPIRLGNSGAPTLVVGCTLQCFSSGRGIEFIGSGTDYTIVGNYFYPSSGKGVSFNASFTGVRVSIMSNQSLGELGSDGIDISALSTDPKVLQVSNGLEGYTEQVASGGTVTPTRLRGTVIRYEGTTTGSAYTVAAPVPTPSTATGGMRAQTLTIQFYNHAGGAVTGWTLNAVYKTASAISTVDGNKSTVIFQWDHDTSNWREIARAVTT